MMKSTDTSSHICKRINRNWENSVTFLTKWGRYGLLFGSLVFYLLHNNLNYTDIWTGYLGNNWEAHVGLDRLRKQISKPKRLCLVLMTAWSECIYQKYLCGNLVHRQSPIPLCLWVASGWCATRVAWQQMRKTDKLLILVLSSTSISSIILFT